MAHLFELFWAPVRENCLLHTSQFEASFRCAFILVSTVTEKTSPYAHKQHIAVIRVAFFPRTCRKSSKKFITKIENEQLEGEKKMMRALSFRVVWRAQPGGPGKNNFEGAVALRFCRIFWRICVYPSAGHQRTPPSHGNASQRSSSSRHLAVSVPFLKLRVRFRGTIIFCYHLSEMKERLYEYPRSGFGPAFSVSSNHIYLYSSLCFPCIVFRVWT